MSYKTRDELVALFKELANKYPSLVRKEILGYTYQGREILCYKIGPTWGGKVVWTGCIHGLEVLTSELLWLYANWLLQKADPDAIRTLTHNLTMIIPAINLDSYRVKRKNANPGGGGAWWLTGVNLNRNFTLGWCGGSDDPLNTLYKGTAPKSESETQAVYNFLERTHPAWLVDLHTGWSGIYKGNNPFVATFDGHLNDVLSNYVRVCARRAVSFIYPINNTVNSGYILDDALFLGAYSLALEMYPQENSVVDGPPFADIEPIWFPRFLPLAIAVSEDCAKHRRTRFGDLNRRSLLAKNIMQKRNILMTPY